MDALDLIRAAFEESNRIDRSDRQAWLAFGERWWADDIVMVEDPRFPGAGEFHGRERVARRFHEYFEAFDDASATVEAIHGGGEIFVLDLLFAVRGAGSGAGVEQRWAWVVTVRDGRVASIRPYLDRGEASGHANCQVIRDYFEAANRREFAKVMDIYADDVEMVAPAHWLMGGAYRGKETIGAWFGDWYRTFGGGPIFEMRQMEPHGDEVAVHAFAVTRGGISGLELDADYFYVFRIEGGQIARMTFFEEWPQALAALGPEEEGSTDEHH